MIDGKHAKKCVFCKLIKVYVPWLPLYFRYSIEAKRVESIRTGSDGSFIGMFTYVLKFLQCLKECREKKIKNEKRSFDETQRSGKHKKDGIYGF